MIADGVDAKACAACADSYGVSDQLREMGIEVGGMGQPLSSLLKGDWRDLASAAWQLNPQRLAVDDRGSFGRTGSALTRAEWFR